MKYTIMAILFITTASLTVNAGPVESLFGQLNKGAGYICRKGSFFDFRFSIRSLEGEACKNRLIGAFAELVCGATNIENYANSKCHNNAKKVLGDTKPSTALKEELMKHGKNAIKIMCAAPIPAISSVCASLPKK